MNEKVLLQITVEDIRRSLERHNSPRIEEDIQEIIEAVSEMEVDNVIDNFILQYAASRVREEIERCLSCPDVRDCREGQQKILLGMEALGKKPITISGRN